MPEYLSPGVYVEEINAGPRPIEGVSTSTAGAVGVTILGPTSGKPELVTSFAEFTRKFGGFVPEPEAGLFSQWALNPEEGGRWWQFALSVKGFFDNGGQRVYIKRISSSKATAASSDFGQGMISEIQTDAPANTNSLKVRHLIGIEEGKQVKIYAEGDPPVLIGDFTVVAFDATNRIIRLNKQLGKAVRGGRDFVEIEVRQMPPPPANQTMSIRATALGDWGNNVRVRVRPMVGATLNLQQDPATGGNPVKTAVTGTKVLWGFEVDDAQTLANGQKVTIKGRDYVISNVQTATGTFELMGEAPNDVLTPEEAFDGKQRIKKEDGTATTVETTMTQPGDTVELTDVGTLGKDDIILTGGKEYTLTADPTPTTAPAGTIKVNPPFPAALAAGVVVKKISAKIISAGTRRTISVEDATNLSNGSHIIFVPTGKQYTLTSAPSNNSFQFIPAIPVGKSWEARSIEKYGGPAVKVETALAAPGDTIELDDTTGLNQDDVVLIHGKRYTLTAAPTATAAPAGTITVTPAFDASDVPSLGVGVEVSKKLATTGITGNTSDWSVDVDDASKLAGGDHILLNGEELVIGGINGNTLSVAAAEDSGNPWPKGTVVRRLRPANMADPTTINVSGVGQLYKGAIVELDNGEKKETRTVDDIIGQTVKLSNALANKYFEGNKLRVIEAEITARYVIDGIIVKEENFPNLRLKDDKSINYFVTNLKTVSSLVEVADPLGAGFPADLSNLSQFPIAANGSWADLQGGDDQLSQLSVDDFVGVDGGSGLRTGIQALEDIDEISICLAPGMWSSTIHSALIQHCEILKDRFAILDPQDGLSVEGIRTVRETLDSTYAALYYPWVEVRDPSVQRNVDVAPSAHVAGIYARVDVERGVHKAPANEVVRGISKIAQDVTKREQDLLNPKGINAIRFFPGRGNRVWGARTISSDAAWKYINVRRLFIYVEESIDEGTQFVVFEPNDEPLWAIVRLTLTNFLTSVWRSGALQGATAAEAFFVKCDHSTMTQDDIDNGRLICLIGIAPVKPAEFVIFRIQQKTLESKT